MVCARALFVLAQLREAEGQLDAHVTKRYELKPDALAGLRERVVRMGEHMETLAVPLEDAGPCGDDRALPGTMKLRTVRLLPKVDETASR